MGRCVLDTSVLIAMERKAIVLRSAITPDEDILVPSIAMAEYLVGLHWSKNPREREQVTRNLRAIEQISTVLEFGEKEAKAFAILKAEALTNGERRTDFDLAIAAHSVVEDAILVTRDKNARLSELTGVVTREV